MPILEENMFGEIVSRDALLRTEFIEPPFSLIDTRTARWLDRRKIWNAKGLRSDEGRDVNVISQTFTDKYGRKPMAKASIFDPVLAEIAYKWFAPAGGKILDVFAGGSVRGIVAQHLGYEYTGIDIRQEQIDENLKQCAQMLAPDNHPVYFVGDSDLILDKFAGAGVGAEFDLLFSCPPYADLEVYSDLVGDISNMKYDDFIKAYTRIIQKSCQFLKAGGHAVFVVAEIRDGKGYYRNFVGATIDAFCGAGLKYYNEAILLNQSGTGALRAQRQMRTKKLVKTHQNVLTFIKE